MTVREFVLNCIERARGDDLARAKLSFKGLSAEQMQMEHGRSGQTKQEILDGYQAHSGLCDAAIKACLKFLPSEMSCEDII